MHNLLNCSAYTMWTLFLGNLDANNLCQAKFRSLLQLRREWQGETNWIWSKVLWARVLPVVGGFRTKKLQTGIAKDSLFPERIAYDNLWLFVLFFYPRRVVVDSSTGEFNCVKLVRGPRCRRFKCIPTDNFAQFTIVCNCFN